MNKHLLALALGLSPFLALAANKKARAKPELLKIDTAKSDLEWEGRKLTGKHNGTLKVKDGNLKVESGVITGGEINLDMTSIAVTDIPKEEKSNADLTGHLKSEDFFGVEKNPTAKIKITKVEPIPAAPPGSPNFTVTADLTIKKITKPISFPAWLEIKDGKAEGKATMEVDRTLYGVKFRSKSFFKDIGDKVIDDKFKIDVKLAAAK